VLGVAENTGGNPIYFNESVIKRQDNRSLFPILKGPYLGQKFPGMIPEIFPPRMLQADHTWFWHGSPSFSPDVNNLCVTKYIKGQNQTEFYWMRKENNVWGFPEKASFTQA
jgi:hypothetical protein